jgi:hypothetical protein
MKKRMLVGSLLLILSAGLAVLFVAVKSPLPEIYNEIFAQIYIGNTSSLENLHDIEPFPIECVSFDTSNFRGIATSSITNTSKPEFMIDHNLTTYWADSELGLTISLDLGSELEICGIEIAWFGGSSRVYNFSVSEYYPGQPVRLLRYGLSSGSTYFPEYYDLGNEKARYITVTGYGNTKNNYTGVSEIRIYINSTANL